MSPKVYLFIGKRDKGSGDRRGDEGSAEKTFTSVRILVWTDANQQRYAEEARQAPATPIKGVIGWFVAEACGGESLQLGYPTLKTIISTNGCSSLLFLGYEKVKKIQADARWSKRKARINRWDNQLNRYGSTSVFFDNNLEGHTQFIGFLTFYLFIME